MVYRVVFPGGCKTLAYNYESVKIASLASIGRPSYEKPCGSCPPPELNQPWRDVVGSYTQIKPIPNMTDTLPAPTVEISPVGPNVQAPAQTAPVQGITSFEDDAQVSTSEPVDFSRSLLQSYDHVEGADSIIDFLKRPSILSQGVFTTSDTTIMFSTDPFLQLMTGVKASKLSGIYGIKADMVVTLNVNATRFMTGRYIMAFLPSGGVPITSSEFGYATRMHAFNLTNFTQLPHVEIDIASQTSVELKIPWQNIYPFYVNQTSSPPVGVGGLMIRPYVALQTGAGDSSCAFTLWASFDNIALTGPTVTQSSIMGAKELASKDKPVSGTLTKIARASTILGEIPLLAPVTSQVSWTASILARAASAMGWSKPMLRSTPLYVRQRQAQYLNNVDQPTLAVNLGSTSDSSTVISPPNNLSNLDEMSIDFIKKVPAYYASVVWGSAVAGTILFSTPITPNTGRLLTGLITSNTPVSMLSKMFMYWRGGLVFRIKFVKNEFYSGRLAFAFLPSYRNTAAVPTLTSSEYLHRVVVDIRLENEVEFEIPYISPEVWTTTNNSIGTIYCFVVDPLVAPDSVPASITMVLEVFGADDLEFAVPINPQWDVVIPVTTQMGGTRYRLGSPSRAGISPSAVCIGEKLESLRQYWKIPIPLSPAGTESAVIALSNLDYTWMPYVNDVASQATSISTAPSPSNYKGDVVGLISSCYCFVTGSMRVFSTVSASPFAAGVTYALSATTLAGVTANKDVTAFTKYFSAGEGFDFEVPSWYPRMSRLVSSSWWNQSALPLDVSPLRMQNAISFYVPIANAAFFTRQPSDTMNCFGFLGCPTVVANRLT